MIKCDRFEQQLSDYLEGEVSEENNKLLNDHETSCKKCAELVINARILSKTLKNMAAILTESMWPDIPQGLILPRY